MELSPALPNRSASQEILHLVRLCDIHCDFEKARYRSLAWTTLIQSTTSFVYGFSHCFLPFTPTSSMSSHFFRFSTKILCVLFIFSMRATCSLFPSSNTLNWPPSYWMQSTSYEVYKLLSFFQCPISSSVWNPNTLSCTLWAFVAVKLVFAGMKSKRLS